MIFFAFDQLFIYCVIGETALCFSVCIFFFLQGFSMFFLLVESRSDKDRVQRLRQSVSTQCDLQYNHSTLSILMGFSIFQN